MEQAADAAEQAARDYLTSLLNKYLRVTVTDGRLFWGLFKCIDPVSHSCPIHAPLIMELPSRASCRPTDCLRATLLHHLSKTQG